MNEEIFALTEKINKDLFESNMPEAEKIEISNRLKSLLPSDSIVIAQADSNIGDIKGNTVKAYKWIKWAQNINASAIIFPELYLVGYPLGDLIKKFPIIVDENIEWLNVLASKTIAKTKVIIGFIDKDEQNNYYNAVAILANGKIENIIRKSVLDNTQEQYESRIFNASTVDTKRIVQLGNINATVLIGNELEQLALHGAKSDLVINCSATISRSNKEQLKRETISKISRGENVPVLFVNKNGTNDGYSCAGLSSLFDKTGNIIARTKAFQEQFFVVSVQKGGEINNLPKGLEKEVCNQTEFSLDYEDDLERTYLTIVQSIKSYFEKTGFKKAVLGLSGGLDSTVSVVLLVDALGAENVLGISMPSKITSKESKNDAQVLAQNLRIPFFEIPIKEMFDTTRKTFDNVFLKTESKWDCRYKESFTNDNIQARSRAMILWGVANEFGNCLPIATSDKSELYMGYATINGDMSGGFAPLANVTKTKLFALAKWLNKNRANKNAIPESIIQKRPGAELAINPKTGKPLLAEEALMPYEFLDEIIWRVENLQESADELLNIEFLYEKINPVTIEQKKEWLDKFFRRMSTGVYKWTIMPPSPIVDAYSINSREYNQPIVSTRVNLKKTPYKEKAQELNTL